MCYHLALFSTKFRPQAMPLSAEPVSRIRKHTYRVRLEGLCSIAATLRRYTSHWQRVARQAAIDAD